MSCSVGWSGVAHLQQQPIKLRLTLCQPIKIQTGGRGEQFCSMDWCVSSTAAANQNQGLHCVNQSKSRLGEVVSCSVGWSGVAHLQQHPTKIKLVWCQTIKIQTGGRGELFGRIEWVAHLYSSQSNSRLTLCHPIKINTGEVVSCLIG